MHSAQRNRLASERLIKQVFVYSNHGSKKAAFDVVAVTLPVLDPGPNVSSPTQSCDVQVLPVSTASLSRVSETIHSQTRTSGMVQVGVIDDTVSGSWTSYIAIGLMIMTNTAPPNGGWTFTER